MKNPGRAMLALVALVLGAAHGLSFAPWTLWWLQILTMAGLVLLVLRQSNQGFGGPASSAYLFGMGTFVAGLCWMYISMNRYGGMPGPMAAFAVVLLAAFLSIYGALAFGLTRKILADTASPLMQATTLAGCWTLMEVGRGTIFTGFPWLSIGYAHLDGPLIGWAPLLGVYGTGFVAMLCATLLATTIHQWWSGPGTVGPRAIAKLPVVILIASLAIGVGLQWVRWTTPVGPPLTVRLIQGNVPQATKFNPQRARQAIDDYIGQVLASSATLNLLPETAWVVPISRTPPDALQKLLDHLKRNDAFFSVGIPLRGKGPGISNSVITLNGDGQAINRYDKRHLVPFGEFVPFGFQWFVDMMHVPLGNFGRGQIDQPLLEIGGQQMGFNICYEDLFGEELAYQVRQGATILANLSNLGWFGDSHALPQHLNLSRFRSVELGRPMLRSTNTGVTTLINHHGQVVSRLAHFKQAALDVTVQGTGGQTPFTRAGLWAPLALSALAIAFGLIRGRRRGTTSGVA